MDEVVICVVDDIESIWMKAEPLFQEAINHSNGEYTTQDLYYFFKYDDMKMLAAFDGEVIAVFATEVIRYPQKLALRLVLGAGGQMDKWAEPLYEAMKAGARKLDADLIEVHGRIGWARYLKKFGAESKYTVMTQKVKL
jgi:hypothetical protein